MNARVKCSMCGKSFQRSLRRINEARKMGWKPYCSPYCKYKAKLRGKMIQCSNPKCRKICYRPRSEILKVEKSYCSRSCAVTMNNKVAPKRIRKVKKCDRDGCHRIISAARKHCSRYCYGLERTLYTKQELIERLQSAADTLGRTPARREMSAVADPCTWMFDSWSKALEAAGLTPNRSHSERMYKRKRTVARDGHRCDSISEAIIDDWPLIVV